MNKIYLDPKQLHDKKTMSHYFKEVFSFEDECGDNLDAIADRLSEVDEDTIIYINQQGLIEIARDEYSYKTLRMLVNVCSKHPYIKLKLRKIDNDKPKTEKESLRF